MSRRAGARSYEQRVASRVVDAQRQAGRFLVIAGAFAISAPLAAVVPHDTGRWLPLHLFLVGAVLSAVAGATQLLAVTWSTAPAPPDGLAGAQRWLLAGGATAVAAGRETGIDPLTTAGATATIGGIGLLVVGLLQVRAGSQNTRFHPAIDAYLLAAGWALAGVGLGLALVLGDPTSSWIRIRDAHVRVNIHGFVGLVIAGTLPFYVATQARTKMSPRAGPGSIRTAIGVATAGVVVALIGAFLGRPGVVAAGDIVYVVALVMVVRLLPVLGRKQVRWAGPRLLQLASGILWWIVTTALLAAATVTDGLTEHRVLAALVVGAFAQILVASLAYFGPVLRGGGHRRLTEGFAITRSWWSLVAGNLAAALLLAGATGPAVGLIAGWALDVLIRAGRLRLAA